MIYSYPKLGFVIETETIEQANFIRDNVITLLEEGKNYSEIKGLYNVTFSNEPINTPIINPEPQEEPKKAKKEVVNNETN